MAQTEARLDAFNAVDEYFELTIPPPNCILFLDAFFLNSFLT